MTPVCGTEPERVDGAGLAALAEWRPPLAPAGSGGSRVAGLRFSDRHIAEGADAVDKALPNAVKKSVAHIDGTSAKKLKAGLADAQAGMRS